MFPVNLLHERWHDCYLAALVKQSGNAPLIESMYKRFKRTPSFQISVDILYIGEFTQGIPDIFSPQSKSQTKSEEPKKKVTLSSFLMDGFQEIIYYWQAITNHIRRPESVSSSEMISITKFKFVPKDDEDLQESILLKKSNDPDLNGLRRGEVESSTVTSGVSIPVSDPEKAHKALAGPDPEPMKEDQTGSDSGKLHVSLAGPNPEHMDDEFLATAYPKVHENLKLITDERVIDDKPKSHSGSMSSMKNLDDTFNFRDQFLYDKPTEEETSKNPILSLSMGDSKCSSRADYF
ncbi:hypothetical protein Tco_1154185 [Tanacetum coccineum]